MSMLPSALSLRVNAIVVFFVSGCGEADREVMARQLDVPEVSRVSVEWFPMASKASTPTVWEVPQASAPNVASSPVVVPMSIPSRSTS